ncbi:alpha/beta-hydrolase family protein [Rhodococcus chondri]|uniref:Alpha/beta-hydrolase family protein n=1 Tax=Rhodococcus chondri TaxID=3065941 RepID=A0ABU7JWE7_9NOCA|nr:alpha/beta-hydrolase family protein [Rhodococcus sp. CC-R104]MEE2034335.1 alpha/beta-hydrolase family protein [Rhodococcus sp. CC-R104]
MSSNTIVVARALRRRGRNAPQTHSGPRVGSTVVVTIASSVSLAPSLLPRGSMTQALFSGILVVVALAVTAAVRRLGRRSPRRGAGSETELRLLALVVASASVAVIGTVAHHWQSGLRLAMDMPAIGPRYWLEVLTGATTVVAFTTGIAHGVRVILRGLGRRGAIAVVAAAAALIWVGAAPAATRLTSAAGAAAGSAPPAAPGASGAPGSLVPWESLDAQGRRFAVGAAETSVRVYVGLGSAPDPRARAALAVRELQRTGGFDRGHLVVAVPTGSGWVDGRAVDGFEAAWGGDVAIVAHEYSDTPSWVTFLFDRGAATESARALVDAVRQHLAALPSQRRPALHVYGQSLGAIGGSAAFADTEPGPCEALWVGPPAGAVRAGRATVLANSSDPVVWWQPSLLWSPPDLSHTRIDAPVPLWLPVVGFLQTTVDLIGSLDAAPGHGHRYGQDQVRCAPDGR